MGYTSSKVKDRWNKKHYDCITARLPIGCRDELKQLARRHGLSVTQFLRWAVLQAVSDAEREQCPILSGRTKNDIDNGYVSPFPPPPPKDGKTD